MGIPDKVQKFASSGVPRSGWAHHECRLRRGAVRAEARRGRLGVRRCEEAISMSGGDSDRLNHHRWPLATTLAEETCCRVLEGGCLLIRLAWPWRGE